MATDSSEDATLRQLVEQLEAQLAAARGEVQKKDELLASLASDAKAELEEAREKAYSEAQRATRLEQELEHEQLRGEVNKLRALEDLRLEHQRAVEREALQRAAERRRMDEWMNDVRESHLAEKEHLLERIRSRSYVDDDVGGASLHTGVYERDDHLPGAFDRDDPLPEVSFYAASEDGESSFTHRSVAQSIIATPTSSSEVPIASYASNARVVSTTSAFRPTTTLTRTNSLPVVLPGTGDHSHALLLSSA